MSGFVWIQPPNDYVLDASDPEYEFWMESQAVEDLAAGAAPPVALPEQPKRPEVPRIALALSREQAAEALAVSVDYFDKHVKPHIRVVLQGRKVLVPVRELERWLDANSGMALKGR